jgi:hypothetical protein
LSLSLSLSRLSPGASCLARAVFLEPKTYHPFLLSSFLLI